MKVRFIVIGDRQAAWVMEGIADYEKRLPSWLVIDWVPIALGQRGRSVDRARALAQEDQRVLMALRKPAHVVLLDETGQQYSSAQLAQQLQHWQSLGCDLALVIGGPDGHGPHVRRRADECWSLSALTLPHLLARLLVIEQLYRATTIMAKHPYHRA